MADWLRPVFARSKSAIQVASPSHSTDKVVNISDDGNEDDLLMSTRRRPTSRVSSYIGFRSSTPPVTTPEYFPNLRNPENTYHKPDPDRLAETLKVVMMTRGAMDPLPIEYNSHVLHILEAFQDTQEQIFKSQLDVEEVKKAHAKDLHEFEKLAEEWESKEKAYKAEVKRLEVLLSKTEGGMATVMMTRTGSKIHGSRSFSESLGRSFGTIKERHSNRNRKDREEAERKREMDIRAQVGRQGLQQPHFNSSTLLYDGPFPRSYGENERSLTTDSDDALHPQLSRNDLWTPEKLIQETKIESLSSSKQFNSQILDPQRPMQYLENPELNRMENCKRQNAIPQQPAGLGLHEVEHQLQPLLRSQETGFASSTEFSLGGFRDMSIWGHNDIEANSQQQKPLPKLPSNLESTGTVIRYPNEDFPPEPVRADFKPTSSNNRQTRFSFQLDDDKHMFSPVIGAGVKKKEVLEEHVKDRRSECHFKQPPRYQQPQVNASPAPYPRRGKNTSGDHASLSRGDSSSSVITAVRHNSGRSIMSTHGSMRKQEPSLNHKSSTGSGAGSSEAVAAAVRAFAGNNNKTGLVARLRPEKGSRQRSKQRETAKGDISARRGDGDDREKQVGRSNTLSEGRLGSEEASKDTTAI